MIYDGANDELMRRLERDAEKEPRPLFLARPRRKQFRYWAGASFRPTRRDIDAPHASLGRTQ